MKYLIMVILEINLHVHILVALHFIPKTEEDIRLNRNIINHKDRIKFNNYYRNLEWSTYEENNKHTRKTEELRYPLIMINNNWGKGEITAGEKNGMHRISEKQAEKICVLLSTTNLSHREISKRIGLAGTENDRIIVTNIATGKRWKHISSKYNL